MSETAGGPVLQRLWTLAEARYILSHVFCVLCVPEDSTAGFSRPWFAGVGLAECCRCPCTETADLRLWIASVSAAKEWLVTENAAIEAHNAKRESDYAEARNHVR